MSIIVLFSGCGGYQYSVEFSTQKVGFYNLYFFGNDSKYSAEIEKDFVERWNTEDYSNVIKTDSYNISDKDNAPNKMDIDLLELNEENTPVFILFGNKGQVLRTENFDEILDYLNEQQIE